MIKKVFIVKFFQELPIYKNYIIKVSCRLAILGIIIILVRLFAFELFSIPSESMFPTLVIGDKIIVNKYQYGSRIFDIFEFNKQKKERFFRINGLSKVKRGDIVVFNYPNLSENNPYGDYFIKRCQALPGEVFEIKNNTIYCNNIKVFSYSSLESKKKLEKEKEHYNSKNRRKAYLKIEEKLKEMLSTVLFPHDKDICWSLSSYGPLIIPAKGETMHISLSNISIYKSVIEFEDNKLEIRNGLFYINNRVTSHYTFKKNYYFMIGDNFDSSNDSRYWGFVPENNIVGKAELVLFSLDPHERWYRKFRWNRLLKRIE
ncbi:MAG: signal peptidase I [Bacteroidales bacterium]|nr:signal peptidase I [Bacteroidales bacterium]